MLLAQNVFDPEHPLLGIKAIKQEQNGLNSDSVI
jgi:hypothetical protein